MEIWKDIEENNNYQISNTGIIKNKTTNQLKCIYLNREYQQVNIDGKTYRLHILVAKAFPEICGAYFDGCEVHHKDHNRTNNNAENLLIVTREKHQEIHLEDGLGRFGMKKVVKLDKNKNLLKIYSSCEECMKDNGILRRSTMGRYLKGKKGKSKFIFMTLKDYQKLMTVYL